MTTPPAPARLHVVLAREAPVGVILRRGPSRWVQMIKWDTATDTFEQGQWFKGRVYENKCDLSPDGELFVYFVFKGNSHHSSGEHLYTWTAISKPPYFTAIALWKEYGTWGGGGHFLDNKTVRIYVPNSYQHPDHPPRGITVLDSESKEQLDWERLKHIVQRHWELVQKGRDVRDDFQALVSTLNEGTHHSQLDVDGDWYQLLDMEMEGKGRNPWLRKMNLPTIWRKQYPTYSIEKHYFGYRFSHGEVNKLFVVDNASDKKFPLGDATWADFDQQGRLVVANEGKLFSAALENGDLQLTELADFNANIFEPIEAPDWAQKW
ncbi:MAG: hypothetical protein GC179_01790 [Anaerolineaceae bacterium]|nr:hypothetical protein [Anaerolineaceae bacterium]